MAAGLSWRVAYPGGKVAPWLRDASPLGRASGCYLIRAKGGRIVYVGSSWSGRLARTIRRHFQRWDDTDEFTTIRGNVKKPSDRWEVAVIVMSRATEERVREAESKLAARYRPTWLARLARRSSGEDAARGRGGKAGRAIRASTDERKTPRARAAASTFLGSLLGY